MKRSRIRRAAQFYPIPGSNRESGVRLWRVGPRIVRGSKVDLSHYTPRCSLASMANEMLPAHDTYYLDDRMTVLSVGTFCWS